MQLNEIYEVFAKQIYQSDMYGFIEVEDYIFNKDKQLVVDPTAEKLKKNRPYIFIGSFVVGMVLTPPDVISQFLIAIPIWLLFEAGLFFSSFFKVRKNNPEKSATKNQPKDWSDKSHNEMMDDIEIEMNSKVIGKPEKDN